MSVALLSAASSIASARLASKLVGTWRLVRFVKTDTSGSMTYPYGERPVGYFVYDPTGHLSVQIMRILATPPRTFATCGFGSRPGIDRIGLQSARSGRPRAEKGRR